MRNYMVEPQYSLVGPPVESGPDVGPELHPDLGPGFGPDLDPDLSRFSVENAYRQVIKQWGNSSWAREPFVAGPAVKRIDLDDLYEAIGIGAAAPAASTDQPTWTMADAIPGGLLGQIRVWLTHPELTGPRPAVRSWRDGYPVELPAWKSGAGPWVGVGLPWLAAAARVGPGSGLYFSLAPKIADPAPVAVPDAFPPFLPWVAMQPTALKLYFAAIAPDDPGVVMTPTHGYGVWCASGIPAPADGGTLLQVVVGEVGLMEAVEPIFGIDFLICTVVDGRGLPRDMIAGDSPDPRGGGHSFAFLDPDPVKDPVDGSWRVHVGMTGGGLTLIVRDAEDGDRSWEEGWCRTPPALGAIDFGAILVPPPPPPVAELACDGGCDGPSETSPRPEPPQNTPVRTSCTCD